MDDISTMSDADLQAIAGKGAYTPSSAPDLSSMSDEELTKIAGAPKEDSGVVTAVGRGLGNSIPGMTHFAALGDTLTSYVAPSAVQHWISPNQADQSGESFGQRYKENLAAERGQDTAEFENHPIISTAAPIAGAVATLPVAGPTEAVAAGLGRVLPGSLARVAAPAVIGAGYGAAYGAGNADTLSDVPVAAETGALYGGVGGALIPPVAGAIGRVAGAGLTKLGLRSAASVASEKIADAVAADRGAGIANLTPEEFAAAKAGGQSPMAADLGGASVGRLGQWAANTSPEAQGVLAQATGERFRAQQPEFEEFLKGKFGGSDLDNAAVKAQQIADARAVNSPAYREAYANNPAVWNDDLAQLMQSPDIWAAVPDALRRSNAEAARQGFPAMSNPFVKRPPPPSTSTAVALRQANPSTQYDTYTVGLKKGATPSLSFWDQIQRTLQDRITAARGKQNFELARDLGLTKNQLLDTLDQAAPEFATARAGAYGAFQAQNALEAGQKFVGMAGNMNINTVKAVVTKMNPQERQLFAQGFAGQLFTKAMTPGESTNLVRMFQSPLLRDKIATALGPDLATEMEAHVTRADAMNRFKTALGNSTTARQAADMAPEGHGFMSTVAHSLGPVLGGAVAGGVGAHEFGQNPVEGAALGAFYGLMRSRYQGANKSLAKAIAEQLTSSDPKVVNAALTKVAKNPALMNALRGTTAYIAPQVVPRLAAPEQQLQPAFAAGGRVEPTEAQKAVGNYKKHHMRVHGLDVTIENVRGSWREGVGRDGKKWRVKMPNHYGYIRGTTGADDDHVDCYVGPDESSDKVFVIDQKDIHTGKFDEHKCMLGFKNRDAAIGGYTKGFSDGNGAKRIQKITPMSIDEFKAWLASGKTREPMSKAA